MKKSEKGIAIIPVLLIIAAFGAVTSGYLVFKDGKATLHKEVLKQGKADYSTVNQ